MKKSIAVLGSIIALIPYEIGINESWKNAIITILGLLIVFLVLVPRKEKIVKEKKKDDTSFVENNPISPKEIS